MARPREHGDDTRDALLRAAGHVLRADGPAALSVRRLADDVGVSTRAIYSLFGGKDGLVRAMFVEGFAALGEELRSVPSDQDPLVHLVALGHAYRRSALSRPHLYAVMFDCPVPEFTPTDEDDALALGTLAILRGAIADAVAAGQLHGDVDEVTFALWGLVHGLVSLELAGVPPTVDTDGVWDTAVQGLVTGLATRG